MLPPLEIVAATLNFGALLLNGRHLFQLPFKNFEALLSAKALLTESAPKQGATQEA
jgi:hypothetical protein